MKKNLYIPAILLAFLATNSTVEASDEASLPQDSVQIPIAHQATVGKDTRNVQYVDENTIVYYNADKLFCFNTLTNEITEFQPFKNATIRSMLLGPFNREKLSLLISGISRSLLAKPLCKDIENTIFAFWKNQVIVLISSNSDIVLCNLCNGKIVLKEPFKYSNQSTDIMCIERKHGLIVIRESKRKIHVVNFFTRMDIKVLQAESSQYIFCAAFHPNGESLLIGYLDCSFIPTWSIRRWDFKKNEIPKILLPMHSNNFSALELYDNGNSWAAKGEVKIMVSHIKKIGNVSKATLETVFNLESQVFSIKVFFNEKFLAAVGHFGIKIWHLDSQKLVFKSSLPYTSCYSLDFSPSRDCMVVIFSSSKEDKLRVFYSLNAIFGNWLDQYGASNSDM